jgi:hypothetical protein
MAGPSTVFERRKTLLAPSSRALRNAATSSVALPDDPVRVGRQLSIRLLEQEVLAYPLLIKPDKCSAMTRVIDLDRHRRQAERGDRLSARQVQRAASAPTAPNGSSAAGASPSATNAPKK